MSRKGPAGSSSRASSSSRLADRSWASWMDASMDDIFYQMDVKRIVRERKISSLAWIVFAVGIIGFIMQLISFGAPGWTWTREIGGREGGLQGVYYGHYNLWYICWRLVDERGIQFCDLISDIRVELPAWWKACQAMAVMSLFCGTACVACSLFYVCSKRLNENIYSASVIIISSILSGTFSAILLIIFGVQFIREAYWCCPDIVHQFMEWRLNYCYILCAGHTLFFLTIGIVGGLELRKVRSEQTRREAERIAFEMQPKREQVEREFLKQPKQY